MRVRDVLRVLRPRRLALLVVGVLSLTQVNCDFWRVVARNNNRNIVNSTFTVTLVGYWGFEIDVTGQMSDVLVEGTFSARGDPDSSILVLVLDDHEHDRFVAESSYVALYNSGRVSSGRVYAELPSTGKYHLVFDNQPSFFNRTVTADIDLKWQ